MAQWPRRWHWVPTMKGNMVLTTAPDLGFDPYDVEITANETLIQIESSSPV